MAKKRSDNIEASTLFGKLFGDTKKLLEELQPTRKIILMCDMVGSSKLARDLSVAYRKLARSLAIKEEELRKIEESGFANSVLLHNITWIHRIKLQGGDIFRIAGEGICACFPLSDKPSTQEGKKQDKRAVYDALKVANDTLKQLKEHHIQIRAALHIGRVFEFPQEEEKLKTVFRGLSILQNLSESEKAVTVLSKFTKHDYFFGNELAYCSRLLVCCLPNSIVFSESFRKTLDLKDNVEVETNLTSWAHKKNRYGFKIPFYGFTQRPWGKKSVWSLPFPEDEDSKMQESRQWIEENFKSNLSKASEYIAEPIEESVKQPEDVEKTKDKLVHLKDVHDTILQICPLLSKGEWAKFIKEYPRKSVDFIINKIRSVKGGAEELTTVLQLLLKLLSCIDNDSLVRLGLQNEPALRDLKEGIEGYNDDERVFLKWASTIKGDTSAEQEDKIRALVEYFLNPSSKQRCPVKGVTASKLKRSFIMTLYFLADLSSPKTFNQFLQKLDGAIRHKLSEL